MSIKLMTRVWDLQLGPEDRYLKLALLALADWANDEGLCYPSQEAIGDRCEISVRAVRDQLARLGELGLVEELARRRRRSKLYQLHIPNTPNQDRKPTSGQEEAKTGSGARPRPEVGRVQDRKPTSAEPSEEPSIEPPPPLTPPRLEPGTVRLARRWCELKGQSFEGSRRWLVPRVAEAVEALNRDGIRIDDELLVRAHRAGIRVPGGWALVATVAGAEVGDCDVCGNHRVVGVDEAGVLVPRDDERAVRFAQCGCVRRREAS